MVVNEHLESHPLGRLEWIKVYGLLVGKQQEAGRLFADTATRYERLKTMAAEQIAKPTVMFGAPYSGSWYVPAGESYMAQFIKDAGGDYLWSDTEGIGSRPLDFERVFLKAAKADVWLNPSFHRSLTTLLNEDRRLAQFAPFQKGKVYNQTRKLTETNSNPIWEVGVTEPDRILADLVSIFHPHLDSGTPYNYFEDVQ